MNDKLNQLLIVGASARAAAAAAAAMPHRPFRALFAADLFADVDLQRLAVTHRLPRGRFPAGAAHWSTRLPPGCWLYTGGLENHPDVVAWISRRHRLLGCDPWTLRQARDPHRLPQVLRNAGLPYLETRPGSAPPPASQGAWLCKPVRSCGGWGILPDAQWRRREDGEVGETRWNGETSAYVAQGARRENATHRNPRSGEVYYQQWVEGASQSGWFVANGEASCWLGSTQSWKLADLELPGISLAVDNPFSYAGSLGPLSLSPRLRQRWRELGEVCTRAFRMQGLFGIDAMVASDESIWPVEINPRFTASMELLERCAAPLLMRLHWNACVEARIPAAPPEVGGPGGRSVCVAAKVVVYASRDCFMPRHPVLAAWVKARGGSAMQLADLPASGSRLQAGQPVLSLLAEGTDEGRLAFRLGLVGDGGIWQQLQRELQTGDLFTK